MEAQKKLDLLVREADLAIRNRANELNSHLFDDEQDSLEKLISEQPHDSNAAYEYYYQGIQSFINSLKLSDQVKAILYELKNIYLTGKEKEYLTYGKRSADSRQADNSRYEEFINILVAWQQSGQSVFELLNTLLVENKKLGYCVEERKVVDYYKEEQPDS